MIVDKAKRTRDRRHHGTVSGNKRPDEGGCGGLQSHVVDDHITKLSWCRESLCQLRVVGDEIFEKLHYLCSRNDVLQIAYFK